MITSPRHELTFDDLVLTGDPDADRPFWFETVGMALGHAVPVEQVMESFLADGAIAAVKRHDNRQVTLQVTVRGTDGAGLAEGESALALACGKRTTLVWTPPDGYAAACLFDVVTSDLEFVFEDLDELRLRRTYTLTITALPFARSSRPISTTTDPIPVGAVTTATVIDDCTSTTGWTAWWGAVGITGGEVLYSPYAPNPGNHAVLVRDGLAEDMTTTPYLVVYCAAQYKGGARPPAPSVRVYDSSGKGYLLKAYAVNGVQRFFISPIDTIAKIEIFAKSGPTDDKDVRVFCYHVAKMSAPAPTSGGSQGFQSIPIHGSARTQGSLSVADESDALGTMLVYTRPEDTVHQPNLRAWRTSGATEVSDTSAITGVNSDLGGTQHRFNLPARGFTAGGHLLVARLFHASAGTYEVTYQAMSRVGGLGGVDKDSQSGSIEVTVPAGEWIVAPIAQLTLPTRPMGDDGLVRIYLSGDSGLLLDEAWLFNVESGQLTWVDCGTGTPAAGGPCSRLWLDAPSVDSPVPAVMVGTDPDRLDSFGAGDAITSFGRHDFEPPRLNVFLVSTGANPATTVDYFPRFHTHVVAPPVLPATTE